MALETDGEVFINEMGKKRSLVDPPSRRESRDLLNDLDLRIRCPICGGFIDPETSMMMCGECFKKMRGKAEMWDEFNKWLDATDEEILDAYNAKNRLEAVKKILKEPVNDTGSGDPGDMAGVINDLYGKLGKIRAVVEGSQIAEEEMSESG